MGFVGGIGAYICYLRIQAQSKDRWVAREAKRVLRALGKDKPYPFPGGRLGKGYKRERGLVAVLGRPCAHLVTVDDVLHLADRQELRVLSNGTILSRWRTRGRRWTPPMTAKVKPSRIPYWVAQYWIKQGFEVTYLNPRFRWNRGRA